MSAPPPAGAMRAAPPLVGHGKRSFVDVDIDPRGKWVAAASTKGRVDLWSLPGSAGGELTAAEGPFRPFFANKTALGGARFSPDGRKLAAIGGDGRLTIWEVPDIPGGSEKHPIRAISQHVALALAGHGVVWSTDGKRLFAVGEDSAVAQLIVGSGQQQSSGGLGGPTHALALAPTHDSLITGSDDDGVRRWDISGEQPRLASELKLHDGWWRRWINRVVAVAVSPDGRTLAVASSRDEAVQLLRLPDLTLMLTFKAAEMPTALAFGDDDGQLAIGGRGGAITIVDLSRRATVAAARPGQRPVSALRWRGPWLLGCDRGHQVHALHIET